MNSDYVVIFVLTMLFVAFKISSEISKLRISIELLTDLYRYHKEE